MYCSVANLGFHFRGGGVQNIFVKVFARGVRGHAPQENFKKWCALKNILRKFCKKKIVKIFIFYIKIIHNVLLRTLYLGVVEQTPQISCQWCNLVCFRAIFRDLSHNPIRSGLFQTSNDPGGGEALKAPPPYDLENCCVNLHHIIHVHFTRCLTLWCPRAIPVDSPPLFRPS